VEEDKHLHDLIRYAEQNPLRAKLVTKTEDWKWSSLYRRQRNNQEDRKLLSPMPTELPVNYLTSVNTLLHNDKLNTIHQSVKKGVPYGSVEWTNRVVEKYGMQSTVREAGDRKYNNYYTS
jgi:putative transposase